MIDPPKLEDRYLDLARKGRGEGILALRDGRWNPSFPFLRRFILRWPGADWLDQEGRGWYGVELIRASRHERALTGLIIRHLASVKVSRTIQSQRRAIVCELARRGVDAARQAIYACFDAANEYRMADEILVLDGLQGLSWLIPRTIESLAGSTAYFWVGDLGRLLGEDKVAEWLAHESQHDENVAAFARLAEWDSPYVEKPEEEPPPFHVYRTLPKSDVSLSPRLWVHRAPEVEIEKAWRAFESAPDPQGASTDLFTDPRSFMRMASALSHRPEHCDIDKVIARARDWSGERNPFTAAIEKITDPRVRSFGLELIRSGSTSEGLDLLERNATADDLPFIQNALPTLREEDEIHAAAISVRAMNSDLELKPLLLWVYEATYCCICREDAVSKLIERGEAPEELLQECLFDCEPDIRKLAAAALDARQIPKRRP